MVLLIIVSVAGLVVSAGLHICVIFHIYYPPRELMMLIQMGSFALVYSAMYVSKKTRGLAERKEFNDKMFKACPGWLLTMTGVLIIYALAGFVFFVFKRYSAEATVTNNEEAIGNRFQLFTVSLMVLYSVALSIFYSCRSLQRCAEGEL